MSTGNPQFNQKPNLHEASTLSEDKTLNEGESDEEIFKNYLEDLKLKPENLDKKILDVGSASAQFGKWVNEHYGGSEVFSLDPKHESDKIIKRVKGGAEAIPFKDETFDLVISNGAIPNVLQTPWEESLEVIKERIRNSLFEMMRVTKPGGEIRLGRVSREMDPSDHPVFIPDSILNTILEELKKTYAVEIEEIHTPPDIYNYDEPGGEPQKLIGKAYLIIIHKPFNPNTKSGS